MSDTGLHLAFAVGVSDAGVCCARVSPLRSTGLGGLPEAFLILPEADPLRDEGLRYAEQLRQAGVRTDARVYPGMIHGFWQMGAVLPQALAAIDDVAGVLRSRLAE